MILCLKDSIISTIRRWQVVRYKRNKSEGLYNFYYS